jgi:hypothetical protein
MLFVHVREAQIHQNSKITTQHTAHSAVKHTAHTAQHSVREFDSAAVESIEGVSVAQLYDWWT